MRARAGCSTWGLCDTHLVRVCNHTGVGGDCSTRALQDLRHGVSAQNCFRGEALNAKPQIGRLDFVRLCWRARLIPITLIRRGKSKHTYVGRCARRVPKYLQPILRTAVCPRATTRTRATAKAIWFSSNGTHTMTADSCSSSCMKPG